MVEQGSLTRAAETLRCTQSNLSHSLDSLEKELGFTLLRRSRAGVRLTNEGERILPAVRNYLGAAEQLRQTASSIRGLESGTVRIGAFTSVAVHWLPPILKEFQRDYPRVDFRLLNGDYHDVEQWLTDGSVDVGFVALPSPVECECIALMEDRLLAILPKHSRFEFIRSSRWSSARRSPSSPCSRAQTTTPAAPSRPRGSSPTSAFTPRTTTPSSPWSSRASASASCRSCF